MKNNCLVVGKNYGRLILTDWCNANHYVSEDFGLLEGDYICFGALMRTNEFTEYEEKTGEVRLRISKQFHFLREGFDKTFYVDNHLNFTTSEISEILDMIVEKVPVTYHLEEDDEYLWIILNFHGASRNQFLFTLNICRRFYRLLLSVSLKIAYNIWKKHIYNVSLFELVILLDNIFWWSMGDDLFSIDLEHCHFDNSDKFFNKIALKTQRYMNFSINEAYNTCGIIESYRIGGVRHDFSKPMERSITRNIDNKISRYQNYEEIFKAYVKYMTYFVKRGLLSFKLNHIID